MISLFIIALLPIIEEPKIIPTILKLIKISPLLALSPTVLPLTQAVDPLLATGSSVVAGRQATSIRPQHGWVRDREG